MVNHDIATVRELMFCTWVQTRMEKLFLQLVKEKLTSLDKFPPLNYHKTLNAPFLFLPLKFQKNFPPFWFTSIYNGEGGYMNTIISLANMKQSQVLFLEPLESNLSDPQTN